jgi:DsbC/DsbD-like thiol-disulfide interchange protein
VALTARIFGVDEPTAIAATVSWLACDEACIPGKRRVVAKPDADARAVIDASRALVPTNPTADELTVASVTRDGDTVVITTSGSLAAQQSDAFPEAVKGLIIQHGSVVVGPASIRIPLRGSAASLPIVVRCGERAVRLIVTLP